MTPNNDREAILALRRAQLSHNHTYTTRKTYRGWMLRYRRARERKQCRDLQGFLDLLNHQLELNSKTIHQALNALKFYHEAVLGIEIPPNSLRVPPLNRNRNIPTWLTHEEVLELFRHMKGVTLLQAMLMYGTAARVRALLTLRLKDVHLQRGLLDFQFDKGRKSRTVVLPRVLIPELAHHIEGIKRQWSLDRDAGIICPSFEPSLQRKLGRATFGRLPWYWLFPSAKVRGTDRWHSTNQALTNAVRRAAEAAGITRRVTLKTLRHSAATALLDRGENIRVIQTHLGHARVETTEIYTHAQGGQSTVSPLDAPPACQSPLVPFAFPAVA